MSLCRHRFEHSFVEVIKYGATFQIGALRNVGTTLRWYVDNVFIIAQAYTCRYAIDARVLYPGGVLRALYRNDVEEDLGATGSLARAAVYVSV